MYLNMNISTHVWCEWLSKTWTPSGPASMASSSFSFSLQHFNDALVSCAASATWKTPFKQHLLCFCLLLSLLNNKFNFSCILYNVQGPFSPLPRSIRKSSFTPIALVYIKSVKTRTFLTICSKNTKIMKMCSLIQKWQSWIWLLNKIGFEKPSHLQNMPWSTNSDPPCL